MARTGNPNKLKRNLFRLIWSLGAAVLLLFFSQKPNYDAALVTQVIDGDTIEIRGGKMVRYIGLDTPEMRYWKNDAWVFQPRPFSLEAKKLNEKLVDAKTVRLEFDVQKRDSYSRLLAYCFVKDSSGNEIFVNEELLKQGLALLYTFPPNIKYVDLFVAAQVRARESKRGIWQTIQTISVSEAPKFIGEVKEIQGIVSSVRSTEKVIFLNLNDGPKPVFKLIIYKDSWSLFIQANIDKPDYYKKKNVRAFGLIKDYNGPEMVINHPSQIEVLN